MSISYYGEGRSKLNKVEYVWLIVSAILYGDSMNPAVYKTIMPKEAVLFYFEGNEEAA